MSVSKEGFGFVGVFFFLLKNRDSCFRSHKSSSASCGELLSPFPKLGTVDWRLSTKRLQLRHRLFPSIKVSKNPPSSFHSSISELFFCLFSFPLLPLIRMKEDGGLKMAENVRKGGEVQVSSGRACCPQRGGELEERRWGRWGTWKKHAHAHTHAL